MTPHICHESKTCMCYLLALEPDERCPVHGCGEWPPRCAVCGRFLKRDIRDNPKAQLWAMSRTRRFMQKRLTQ